MKPVFLLFMLVFSFREAFAIVEGESVSIDSSLTKSTVAFMRDRGSLVAPVNDCSGTLISPDLVLTAAHCVRNNVYDYFAWFGAETPKSKNFNPSHKIMTFTYRVHPRYKEQEHFYDIAIIRLFDKAPEGFKPVSILDPSYKLASGTELTIAGFGRTKGADDLGNLRSKKVPLLSYNKTQITTPKGPCFGDSGGPAYLEKESELYLVGAVHGITTTKKDCLSDTIYMDVSQFQEFILESAKDMKAILPSFKNPYED